MKPVMVLGELLLGSDRTTELVGDDDYSATAVIQTDDDGEFHVTVTRHDELKRLRHALDWIEAEPEDPLKVQMWARAALYGASDLPDPSLQELRRQEIMRQIQEDYGDHESPQSRKEGA